MQTLTTDEVARLCGVSRPTVVRWIESGRLDAYRTPGGHRRILRPALDAFCRRHGVPLVEPGQTRAAIMVVDDEPVIRGAMVELLAEIAPGVPVLTAEDAFQAGQLFAAHQPRLIFLDLMLPGLDGFRFHEHLTANPGGLDTVVVAITGAQQYGLEQRVRAQGIQHFLRKPFSSESVRRLVERYLPRD